MDVTPSAQVIGAVVVFGLEAIIEWFLKRDVPRQAFQAWLDSWLDWENAHEENVLYLIGADVGKGIVPMEPSLRLFRDMVGWCYQDVTKKADRVDVIWYGINEQIK